MPCLPNPPVQLHDSFFAEPASREKFRSIKFSSVELKLKMDPCLNWSLKIWCSRIKFNLGLE